MCMQKVLYNKKIVLYHRVQAQIEAGLYVYARQSLMVKFRPFYT